MEVSITCSSKGEPVIYQMGVAIGNRVITVTNHLLLQQCTVTNILVTFKSKKKVVHCYPTEIKYFSSSELLYALRQNLPIINTECFPDSHVDNSPFDITMYESLSTFIILGGFSEHLAGKDDLDTPFFSRNKFTLGEEIHGSYQPNYLRYTQYCLTNGIVSAVYEESQNLILTDMKLSAGCSGAPIYRIRDNRRELIGVVITRLRTTEVDTSVLQPAGLSFVTHISIFEDAFNSFETLPEFYETLLRPIFPPYKPKKCSPYLVRIMFDCIHGSGLIISSNGIILTNAHVVKYKTGVEVKIQLIDDTTYTGIVQYACDENSDIDVAIISMKEVPKPLPKCTLSSVPPVAGEVVFLIGHVSFRKHSIQFMSRGILSLVKHLKLTSTCLSIPGCSGGAVIRPNGEVIGLVYGAQPVESFSLSESVRISVLLPYILNYLEDQDVKSLHKMEITLNKEFWSSKL